MAATRDRDPARSPGARLLPAALVAGLLVLVATLVAHAAESRREHAAEALRLVSLPYTAFELAAAGRAAPFDWTSDGCSHTPRALAARFAGPCRQHDFAYRNLGRGLRLGDGEKTRAWADRRFLAELRRRCSADRPGRRIRHCRAVARAMWAAVRRFGPAWTSASAARLRERQSCSPGASSGSS